jgi:FG-GAP-like repeat
MSPQRFANRLPLAGIAFLCLAAFLWVGRHQNDNADQAVSRLVRMAAVQGATHFAIADFDGDLQPDMASIHAGASTTEYSVDLKFSSGPRPAIGIHGPAGGLQITPQDVNGDKFADLVVTSLLDAQFVAIFLNDGKGNFTPANASDFPAAGKRTNTILFAPGDTLREQLTLQPSRGTKGGEGSSADWRKPRETFASGLHSSPLAAGSQVALPSAGRAPPCV